MKQTCLPFLAQHDETDLTKHFREKTGTPVLLTLTDNSVSMLSVRQKGSAMAVRLHRIFLQAGPAVLDEIAGLIAGKRARTPAVREFIRRHHASLKAPVPRRQAINPVGTVYNLADIFSRLNREYFNGTVSASITWGRQTARQAVARRTLGSYRQATDLIRISPVLDSREVPRYALEFVVYHEMLHAVIGVAVKNGRRVIHSPEFKSRERLFRQYAEAREWEQKTFRCRFTV